MPPLNKTAYKPGAQPAVNPFAQPTGKLAQQQSSSDPKPSPQSPFKPLVQPPIGKPVQQQPAPRPSQQPTNRQVAPAAPARPVSKPVSKPGARLESWAFYILLATLVLSPLAFWSSQYVSIATVKTFIISAGVLVSAVLYGIVAVKERKLALPPKSMVWIGVLMALSLIVSAFVSGHAWKSIFGQGFEIDSGSFILLMFLSAAVVCAAVFRRAERAIVMYAALVGPFILLWIFHALRLILGANFMPLLSPNTLTTTIFGDWYSLAVYSMAVAILGLCAIIFLPLSRRIKIAYWVLIAMAGLSAFIINSSSVWQAAALVLLGIAIYASVRKPRPAGGRLGSFLKRLAWVPVIAFIVAALLVWNRGAFAGSFASRMNVASVDQNLPWQMTLDVGTSALKAQPLFGTGPGRFGQAFLSNKPAGINQTDAWSIEFNTGWSLISTYMIEQGLIGIILWVLLFVFIGLLGKKSLARASAASDPSARFVVVSSFAGAVFVWIVSLLYVPSQSAMFLDLVMTGIWLGASSAYGYLSPAVLPPATRPWHAFQWIAAVLSVLAAIWGVIAVKDAVALAYFGKGIEKLAVSNDPVAADADFRAAVTLNPMDVYWRGRVEADLAQARALVGTLTASTDASTSQSIATRTVALGNQAAQYAMKAISSDPSNYYNYLEEARVAELAVSLRMQNGYQTGVQAYGQAIARNPGNPSLYLSLARLQVSQNDLNNALQTIGAALQVKNNYLDAVFLLSQVEAAKGNLPDAITAAQFAIGLNSTNPLLYFQLGLLQYMNNDYAGAAGTLGQAVKLQPDYANAQYFLGLADARLGHIPDAVAQFQALAASNPDNQEVALILANLRAGKSPFTGAVPPVSTAPEKRSKPPISEKQP